MPSDPVPSPGRGRGGWWGIAFAVGLLVVGGMVSLPTAALDGERIVAFYAAHRSLIVAQQVVSVLILVPWLWFATAFDRRAQDRAMGRPTWLIPAALLLIAAELATNAPPLLLAAMADPSPSTAHALTAVEDVADAVLFAAIAGFSLVAARAERSWVRLIGVVVGGLSLVRAVASPLGVTALDAAAPLAFLAFVLILSLRLLVDREAPEATHG